MPRSFRHAMTLLLLVLPVGAQAQGLPLPLVPHVYAGVEAGSGTRGASSFGVDGTHTGGSDPSVDYGLFAGVELPSFPLGYLAIEGGIADSKGKTEARVVSGATAYRVQGDAKMRWSGTARLGINALPGLAAYGIAGYGSEKVDVTVTNLTTNLATQDSRNRGGPIYGIGARYTFGTFLGARIEYRRQETKGGYDPEQIMGGLYFRL